MLPTRVDIAFVCVRCVCCGLASGRLLYVMAVRGIVYRSIVLDLERGHAFVTPLLCGVVKNDTVHAGVSKGELSLTV